MRDFKGMKRQRGRNRSGGGGGGSGRPQQNTNRAFDSNGPDGVKVRGAAQHVYEKYQQFARDAHTSGDRVLAENYLQHAEHYFRVMRAMQPQRPLSEIIGRDNFVSGYDIDFEEENGTQEAQEGEGETERQDRFDGRPEDRQREDYRPAESRPQEDRSRDERPYGERPRDDRSREERFRDDRPREDRPARAFRDDRPRYNRDERPARFDAAETRDGVAPATVTPQPSTPVDAPRMAESTGVLRADDGDTSHAPAFLQVRPVEPREDGAGEARRPRRRRAAPHSQGADSGPSLADAAALDEG